MSKFLIVRLKDGGQNTRLAEKLRILIGVEAVEHDDETFDGSSVLKVILTKSANVDKVAIIARFLGGIDSVDVIDPEAVAPERADRTA